MKNTGAKNMKCIIKIAYIISALFFFASGNVIAQSEETIEEAATDSVVRWLASNTIRLNKVEAGNGFTDMQPLKNIVGDARIVALGEPTHGNREIFQLKHRMIEFLVTEMGFNVFALESPMAETFDLNEYVLNGVGDPEKALAGIYYWTWDTEEVLAMIEWIRGYNVNPAHERKVRFYGFDMQDPERAARVMLEYLQRVDPPLAESVRTDIAILATPFSLPEYGGRRPMIPDEWDAATVRAIGQVLSSFDANKNDYIQASSAKTYTFARQHAQVLAQYIEAANDNWTAVRDSSMAENVRWILEQEGDEAKVILWAHNSHIANHSPWGFKLMGAHLRRMYGPEMVIFGILFNRGNFRAIDAADPSEGMRTFIVGPAPGGTVEAMFSSANLEMAAVDLRQFPLNGPVAEWFSVPRATRHSGGGYNENNPQRYLLEYTAPEAFDALVYIDSTTAVRPINEADYEVLWVREQMLPSPVNIGFEAGPSGEVPDGWLAWSKHQRVGFEIVTTDERPYQGTRSAVIHRPAEQRYGEIAGSLTQRLDATSYRGKKIRLKAAARAEVEDPAFAFLRLAIEGQKKESVHDVNPPVFDSLDKYRVTSEEWREYEIVAEVPEDAVTISYGIFLNDHGSVWLDEVELITLK